MENKFWKNTNSKHLDYPLLSFNCSESYNSNLTEPIKKEKQKRLNSDSVEIPLTHIEIIGKDCMSKNNRAKKESTKIYAKEVKKNLEDLEWHKTQFQSTKKPATDNIQEMRLKIELIKYLSAELENYQKEVNLLKQSLNGNEGKTKTP